MKAKKTNYQVTIGYKAVLTMDVKAENEEDAKKLAIEEFKGYLHFGNKIVLQDDSYGPYGVVNLDKTWNQL